MSLDVAMATPHLPAEFEVACPWCADDRCEHDLWVCAECGGQDCSLCGSTGVIRDDEHPDWCNTCGLTGKCRACDEDWGKS